MMSGDADDLTRKHSQTSLAAFHHAFYVKRSVGARRLKYGIYLALIFSQALWGFIVPIRNVALLVYPTYLREGLSIQQRDYIGRRPQETVVYQGHEVLDLMNRTLQVALDNPATFRSFIAARGFVFDSVAPALSTAEYETIADFTTLVVQATMFPPSQFLPREEFYYYADKTQPNGLGNVTYVCREQNRTLQGQRCVNKDGEVCGFYNGEVVANMTFVNFTESYIGAGIPVEMNSFALNQVVFDTFTHLHALFKSGTWQGYLTTMAVNRPSYSFGGPTTRQ
ncbi:hypothetical protein PINS_up009207 [Pythium insidiosum]|nr:hypothetical protein PINS_up009207 [Pythium insidiosum]